MVLSSFRNLSRRISSSVVSLISLRFRSWSLLFIISGLSIVVIRLCGRNSVPSLNEVCLQEICRLEGALSAAALPNTLFLHDRDREVSLNAFRRLECSSYVAAPGCYHVT